MKFIPDDFLLPKDTEQIGYQSGFFLVRLPDGEQAMAGRILATTHDGLRSLVYLRRNTDKNTFERLAADHYFPRGILSGQLFIDCGPAPEVSSKVKDEVTGMSICLDANESPLISFL